MDWGFSTSAPSSNNDRPAASGGWSDSDDDNFSSYETTQTLAIEKTILAVEDELYAIALTTNPNFPPPARISTPNPTTDDNNYADTSPEAAVSRWYAAQDLATKPPFDEWASHFPFLRVTGTAIPLPSSPPPISPAVPDETIIFHCDTCMSTNPTYIALRSQTLALLATHLAAHLAPADKIDETSNVARVIKYAHGAPAPT